MKISKFIIIYIVISIVVISILSVILIKKNQEGLNSLGTNQIQLTNYVYKNTPKYVNVNLTNINFLYNTNKDGTINTNLMIVMKINEYSNLILIVTKYSNYSQSLIEAKISNDFLYLSHYEVSNIIKLPNIKKNKPNILAIGLTFKRSITFDYGYKFIQTRDYDIGLMGGIYIPTVNLLTNDVINIDYKLNIFGEW
jgi:hypothetical protein